MINTTHEQLGWDFCEFLNYDSGNDLVLYEIGTYVCGPGYSYGPIIRNRDIFHYIKSGCGKLVLSGREFHIHAGQGFLIPAGCLAYYEADEKDPWDYCWLHLSGYTVTNIWKEMGLNAEQPVYTSDGRDHEFEKIYEELIQNRERQLYTLGKVCELLDELLQHSATRQDDEQNLQLGYIRKIINYIHVMYSSPIQLNDMAAICGLDRSYMSRLFKDATGASIHTYLVNYRIKKAKELLRNPDLSIQYISMAVGYSDAFSFSKAFKKITGVSPRQWRSDYLDNAAD